MACERLSRRGEKVQSAMVSSWAARTAFLCFSLPTSASSSSRFSGATRDLSAVILRLRGFSCGENENSSTSAGPRTRTRSPSSSPPLLGVYCEMAGQNVRSSSTAAAARDSFFNGWGDSM